MTTGEKINKLAATKRRLKNNANRITKLVNEQNKLAALENKLLNSISSTDMELFSDRLTKLGYLC